MEESAAVANGCLAVSASEPASGASRVPRRLLARGMIRWLDGGIKDAVLHLRARWRLLAADHLGAATLASSGTQWTQKRTTVTACSSRAP